MGAPYIYDISHLRVNELTLIILVIIIDVFVIAVNCIVFNSGFQ